MLRKLKVSNFKCFNETFELDLTDINNYSFNSECIKNETINNAIVYGRNGVGKSNLALAIFDIIQNLIDNPLQHINSELYKNYLNAFNNTKCLYNEKEYGFATFYVEFLINDFIVIYEYKKIDYKSIVFEKFTINNEILASIDRTKSNKATFNFKGTDNLKNEIENVGLSILKYVKNNAVLENNKTNAAFLAFFNFIDRMLYFRCLQDSEYIGKDVGITNIFEDIIEKENVEEFEFFLNKAGIECKLVIIQELWVKKIAFYFGLESNFIVFENIASQGTWALALFYFWFQRIKKSNEISFVFIDEFDAFYHHELSALIVKELKKTGVQFILTTHNTTIISNELLRPDCYFLMQKNTIKSLSKCTEKELREAHNLEKMYKSGMFNGN